MINSTPNFTFSPLVNPDQPFPVTFSILARDAKTGEMGCAAATGNLAVGAWVLKAESGAGLVASQGFSVSVLWGTEAMRALVDGLDVEQIVKRIVERDRGSDSRQLAVLDSAGYAAAWSGPGNEDVKAHEVSPNLVVAGNWLANEHVLPALRATFLRETGAMAERLLRALEAAACAGSDARGVMSAAVNVISATQPPLNLRIDYSETPIADLITLHEMTREREYQTFLGRLPTLVDPQRF